ncbi:hypothetical protein QVD99_001698 [Batrachochytrium dendrobatidis]|nr:hypothetical protein O5D80_000345 [Batrachochytrium dendrobatidis]KAK5671870.1 hypothetical protein QVD99_001698 [Batrachochytrium dendrobatidis]
MFLRLPKVSPPIQMSSVATFVESTIQGSNIVVFAKTTCSYCFKAKQLLESKGLSFFVVDLDKRNDGPSIQSYLTTKTNQRTVPNIFIKQAHIGGYSDLSAYSTSGGLDRLLN